MRFASSNLQHPRKVCAGACVAFRHASRLVISTGSLLDRREEPPRASGTKGTSFPSRLRERELCGR